MTATAQTQESRDEARGRAFSERGPVARSYRKFLGRSMLLMFALVIISTLLLPMLYMVTTAFQQPGQSTTPGAPVWPAAPQTARTRARTTPSTPSRSDGDDARADPDRARPRVERVHRSDRRDADADRVAGSLADAGAGVDVRADSRQFHDRLEPAELPAAALQHGRDRAAEHDRRGPVVDPRRLRVRALPLPRQERPVHHPDRDDHPAIPGHAHPAIRAVHVAGLERDVAAIDHPPLLRQRLQRLPAAPVLPVDPARARRGGDDRRRRPVPDPAVDHHPAVDPRDHGGRPVPLLLRLERLLPAAAVPRRASPSSRRCRSRSSSTTRST